MEINQTLGPRLEGDRRGLGAPRAPASGRGCPEPHAVATAGGETWSQGGSPRLLP